MGIWIERLFDEILGRARRTATQVHRLALQARDGGCAVAGCGAPPARCHAHHLDTWHRGGDTDLDRMALVCHDHHIRLHEGGHTLVHQPDGSWSMRPPGNATRHETRPAASTAAS